MSDNQQGLSGLPQAPSTLPAIDIIEDAEDSNFVAQVDNVTGHASNQNLERTDSSSDQAHIPMVIDSMKPNVGMKFETVEEAFEFYNLYAKQAGFSVRKGGEKLNSKGVVRYKQFVCNKEGKTDNKRSKSGKQLKRNFGETRTKCKASMAVKPTTMSGHKYMVLTFIEEHNHPLTSPRKVHMLRSHRNVIDKRKKLINRLSAANIRPSQQMNIFEEECDGYKNVGCTSRDVENHTRDEREEANRLDAQMLNDYFADKAKHNSSFVYTIKKDNVNRITHVFWCDGIARTNYNKFGTVVSFDTIYKTNRYNLMFAPFMGVNHHGRSILFGCGFLPSNTVADFVWLFKEWQKAMSGNQPRCIVTDQDQAMTKAIAEVFPNATHRYCIWHIMDKVPKYLGALASNAEFNYVFNDVVYSPETTTEFEMSWVEFLERFGLRDHVWLYTLYELRGKWIPAYLHGQFFVAIHSTQRSETINELLKHVHESNSFCDLMLRYERFIGRERYRELQDDYETFNSKPRMKTSALFEQHMAARYTKKMFLEFQEELFYTMACIVAQITDDETVSSFLVTPPGRENDKCSCKPRLVFDRPRTVVLKKLNSYATCSCRMFEFEGIPCRHLLSVLVKVVNITEVPKEYILERWTRDAKKADVIYSDRALVKAIGDESLVSRHSFLSQILNSVVDQGSLSKEAFLVAVEVISKLVIKLREINLNIRAITPDKKKKGKQVVDNLGYHDESEFEDQESDDEFETEFGWDDNDSSSD